MTKNATPYPLSSEPYESTSSRRLSASTLSTTRAENSLPLKTKMVIWQPGGTDSTTVQARELHPKAHGRADCVCGRGGE